MLDSTFYRTVFFSMQDSRLRHFLLAFFVCERETLTKTGCMPFINYTFLRNLIINGLLIIRTMMVKLISLS